MENLNNFINCFQLYQSLQFATLPILTQIFTSKYPLYFTFYSLGKRGIVLLSKKEMMPEMI